MYSDYSFIFDIDGTLCPIKNKNEDYKDLVPYSDMVEQIRKYKENGAKIILYTSRNMNSYNGNIGLINKYTAPVLLEWLKKWNIPFDEIVYGKAWPGHKGFYVDDRTIRPDEFLKYSLEELETICKTSRCNEGDCHEKKIDIVITMAGLGSRFRNAGYTVPKYMIEVNEKTLFEWSMISLDGCKRDINQYIFIAMRDESVDVKNFIENQCKSMNINNYHIIVLDYLTDGQATTAKLASKFWNKDNALLIYNIDTYVEPGEIQSDELKGDGFIPCFQAEGDHWSFVRLDDADEVVEIKEKQRISNYCTLGAYYFKTCKLYEDLYEDYYGRPQELVNGEKYVAPLYNHLLSKNGKIYISNINPNKVHVLGTPEELEAFRKI